MSTIKDYQKVIEILLTKTLDQELIVKNLAKENPKVFLKCCIFPNIETLDSKICRVYEKDGVISAIKEYRTETKLGLKESKDYVQALAIKHNLKKPVNSW